MKEKGPEETDACVSNSESGMFWMEREMRV